MSINRHMALLMEELRAGDVPDPLSQQFTLAEHWDDLCRLAGEEVPVQVLAQLEECTALVGPAPRIGCWRQKSGRHPGPGPAR